MAGKIVADTLEHSTAGSIATNYVVEGTIKAWGDANHSANTITDSFNISTITDDGTGLKDYNFTTSFGSANFIGNGDGGGNEATTGNGRVSATNGVWTSGQAIIRFLQVASTGSVETDSINAYAMFIGDLA